MPRDVEPTVAELAIERARRLVEGLDVGEGGDHVVFPRIGDEIHQPLAGVDHHPADDVVDVIDLFVGGAVGDPAGVAQLHQEAA